MKETISMKLLNTLQRGKEQLNKEALDRIAGFVESQRTEEESFKNKSGKADLYYTLFGWILSYILGITLDRKKMTSYLSQQDIKSLDLIHYAAFMRCRVIKQLIEGGKAGLFLRSLFSTEIRLLDEFEDLPHSDMQSPYTQFIWLSLLEDTGQMKKFKLPGSKFKVSDSKFKDHCESETLNFEFSPYHVNSGGFMNTRDGLTATTNATVAALAVKGQLAGYKEIKDVFYLRDLQGESGGFGAAKVSPVPDLLSTATSLFMLSCYGIKPKYPARDFIEAHWLDSGGFSATLLDDESDVEYTFYGLLALGAAV